MKYKVGDRVRIKSREWYEKNKDERGDVSAVPYGFNFNISMAECCGREATIVEAFETYRVDIDNKHWLWNDGMFEDANDGAKEGQTKMNKMRHKIGDKVRIKSLEWYNENKDERGCVVTVCDFNKNMCKYCGKETVIVNIEQYGYNVEIDSGAWIWDDAMFEDITENTEPTSFRKLTDELADTLERKNHDYGNSFADLFQRYGMTYSIIHLAEKLGRIETLANQPNKVDGESIKDSLKDLAGYCLLTLKEME